MQNYVLVLSLWNENFISLISYQYVFQFSSKSYSKPTIISSLEFVFDNGETNLIFASFIPSQEDSIPFPIFGTKIKQIKIQNNNLFIIMFNIHYFNEILIIINWMKCDF